eukprot:2713414-Pyramimonas_sp.AAC.2
MELKVAYDVQQQKEEEENLDPEAREKRFRALAKCPTMILDLEERRVLRFDSKNALIRDPMVSA